MTEPQRVDLAQWAERIEQRHPPTPAADDVDLIAEIATDHHDFQLRRWHSSVPQRFRNASLTDFRDASFYDDVTAWSFTPAGRNLVIGGPVGTGKSHLAVAACRPASFDGLDVHFYGIVRLLDMLRPGDEAIDMDDVLEVDRLILDDVGMERSSDWTSERVVLIINERWLAERPTVVTTNLAANDLCERLGPQTFSRLIGNRALTVRLVGNDRRRG